MVESAVVSASSLSFFFFFFFFFSPLSLTTLVSMVESAVVSASSVASLSFFFFFFSLFTSTTGSGSASSSFFLSFFFFFFFSPSTSSSTLIFLVAGFSSSSLSSILLFFGIVTSAAALYSTISLLASYLSNLAPCLAVPDILVATPPSSCLILDSTFALCSIPRSVFVSSPRASTRVARAALAASMRLTFPFILLLACPTSCAW